MDAGRWQRALAIFDRAIDEAPASRANFVITSTEGDAELRRQVERLLQAHDSTAGILDRPAPPIDPALVAADSPEADATPVSRIGPHRIVRELGRGGMGTVYLARRDDIALDREVAIKVIRQDRASHFVKRRFETERRVLASLEHPGIARLCDGGTTGDGDPYFVMEFVEGVSLIRYCDDRGLGIPERVRLLCSVCDAVQFAHQNLVIHRDLKPSNVLVTAGGESKLLDFGIAKLLNPGDADGEPDATLTSLRVMTPEYASPEQVLGRAVTTASDVYSLGAILYELLSGRRPYQFPSRAVGDVERTILESEPPLPSSVAPAPLSKSLRGDLDTIVLKALSKDPVRRYATASELADDLRRHLEGLPVRAQPDRLAYRAAKFVRRHRVAVVATAAAVLALVAGLGVAVWQARIASLERARAERRFDDTRALANALVFKINDVLEKIPGATPARRLVIDEAIAYLEKLRAEAEGNPRLLLELGMGYTQVAQVLGNPSGSNLGDRAGAVARLEQARSLFAEVMKALDPAFSWDATRGAILANGTMATIHSTEGRHQEAHALAVESLGLAERLVALRPADTQARESVARAAFFVALTFKQGDSVPLWRQAGTHYEALLKEAPDDPARMRNVALVEKYLGGEIDRQDRDDEALVHYRRALELDERILAQNPDDRQALFDVAIDLGNIAAATRDSQARLPVLVRSLAIRERLAKLDPADEYARGRLARTHRDLALAHLQLGDLGSADTHTAAAEQGYRLLAGTGAHQGLTQERAELFQVAGDIARARGHHEAACARYRESVSEWRRLPAPPAGSATNRWRQSAEKSAAACQ